MNTPPTPNRYQAICTDCRKSVPAGEGFLYRFARPYPGVKRRAMHFPNKIRCAACAAKHDRATATTAKEESR